MIIDIQKIFLIIVCVSSVNFLFADDICEFKPNLDIATGLNFVEIKSKNHTLIINDNMHTLLDQNPITLNAQDREKARTLYEITQNSLPKASEETYALLNSLHLQFSDAIDQNLEGNKQLKTMLNRLYLDLTQILKAAIYSKDDFTFFSADGFNAVIDSSTKRVKSEATALVAKSIFTLNVKKNARDIKYLSKQEWKKRKPELKDFQNQTCTNLEQINQLANDLLDTIFSQSK